MGDEYSKTERGLAQILHRFPGIRKRSKRLYQRINFHLHKKNYFFQSAYKLHTLPVEQENFFGYYDKSPLSSDGRYLLFHQVEGKTNLLPTQAKKIDIVVFDMGANKAIFDFPTFSYNWQQGARLQWIGEEELIFNEYDLEKDQYQAVIFNINNQQKRIINKPVYDCFKNQYALTLNFQRLLSLRPDYGYRNKPKLSKEELKHTDEDGIFYVDLTANVSKLLVGLTQLKQFNPLSGVDNAVHGVNHIMIAPDGEHFIFLHRYFIQGRRYDRLFVEDRTGKNLKLLADDGMVSHCYWLNNKEVIGYLRDKESEDRYYKIDISSGKKSVIGEGKIDRFGDGHPAIFGNKMIFDTYPDKARMKHLFLFDLKTEELKQLGEFYEGFDYYDETRCDLHPCFNFDGTRVYFDSVHEGERRLYWINL